MGIECDPSFFIGKRVQKKPSWLSRERGFTSPAAILAGVITAISGFFGIHHAPPASLAAAATFTQDTAPIFTSIPQSETASTTPEISERPTILTTTIIQTDPVLRNQVSLLTGAFSSMVSLFGTRPVPVIADNTGIQSQIDALQRQISLTNNITNLSNVTITNPTITGGSITDTSGASGGSGGVSLADSNFWTALQTFSSGAAATNLSVFGTAYFGGTATSSFASDGVLTLARALAISSGGTGTTTAPTYGQLLLGNISGGYDLVATSSLGILSGGTTAWGDITGTLSDQTDLQAALDARLTLTNWYATTTLPNLTTLTNLASVGTVTSGTWSGLFGAVSGASLTNLTAANIAAGTAGINISGNASTVTNGVYTTSFNGLFDTQLGTKSTTNIIEGSNQYFTPGRVDDVLNASTTIPKTSLANIWNPLQTFTTGFISNASSTIGSGALGGGLTVYGAATTTGNLIVQGSATSTFSHGIEINGGCILLNSTCVGGAQSVSQLVSDYVVDSGSASINVGDIVSYINGNATKAVANFGATITAGTPVALNAVSSSYTSATALDSTHFVVGYTGLAAAVSSFSVNTITAGTPVTKNDGVVTYTSAAALDSTHFVVAYRSSSSTFVKAVIGTVSGTTITYGTPTTLNAVASTYVSVAALDSTHFVVSYKDNNTNYPNAVVSTVSSGTTITPGTPVALAATSATYTSVSVLDSTKFVVAYVENGVASYPKAVVSTVSGTTITAGTPVALNAVASIYTSVAALDSTHFVVAYQDTSTTFANAVVSTVAGTTITAGTPTALNAVVSSYVSVAALDSTHFVVAYSGASSYANAVASSVSGTTITAGPLTALNAVASTYTSVAALSSGSFVVGYVAGSFANAVAGVISSSPNALGMATNAASAGGTVTVASDGIVTGFTGLTAGSTYYFGAAGLTTSVQTYKVGIALTTTSILLNSTAGSSLATDQFFGDMVFANAFRIAEDWTGIKQGLIFKNQFGRQIAELDENGNLDLAGAFNGVLGLPTISSLFATSSAATSTSATSTSAVDWWSPNVFLSVLFENISQWLASAVNGIGEVFADAVHTRELTFERAEGDEVDAQRIIANELCARKSDGTIVCVTGDQLSAAVGAVPLQDPPADSGTTSEDTSDDSGESLINTDPEVTNADEMATTTEETTTTDPEAPAEDEPDTKEESAATSTPAL